MRMRKYKVLKEFVSSNGGYIHKEGSKYRPTKSASRTANLERLGYIEEIPEQPKTIWDLEEGDKWYFITYDPEHCYVSKTNNLGCIDSFREIGNVFLTIEGAQKELARYKARQILLRDTKGFMPDWDNWSAKYYVFYDYVDEIFRTDFTEYRVESMIYFAALADAKNSIKIHEKEWKTYLGIDN